MKSKIIGVCPNCGKPVVEREKKADSARTGSAVLSCRKDNAFFKRLGKRLDSPHVADKLLRDGRSA